MIRREPTMIPMSDSDVQDVRDLVAGQILEYEKVQQMMKQMKRMAERPLADEEVPMLMHVAQRHTERLERERRLGIQPSGGKTLGTEASASANNASGRYIYSPETLRALMNDTLQDHKQYHPMFVCTTSSILCIILSNRQLRVEIVSET